MDLERVREFLLRLPAVTETMQWGAKLVFRVGDKAIGGKMFAVADLDGTDKVVLSFAAGPEQFAALLERQGVLPAPYLARAHWVALERWNALEPAELMELLARARDLTHGKLPRRTREILADPGWRRPKTVMRKSAGTGVP
jgi:predicted DNA-binding protein (MmcQ/YjbR family)